MVFRDGKDTWVSLISENALVEDGAVMGHCVGGYWPQVKGGTAVIYSLRDSQMQPHCTIEYSSKYRFIEQIKGKGNKGTAVKYWEAIKRFLEYMVKESLVRSSSDVDDLELNGLFMKENQVYNSADTVYLDDGEEFEGFKPTKEVTEEEAWRFISDYPILIRNIKSLSDRELINVLHKNESSIPLVEKMSGYIKRNLDTDPRTIRELNPSVYDQCMRVLSYSLKTTGFKPHETISPRVYDAMEYASSPILHSSYTVVKSSKYPFYPRQNSNQVYLLIYLNQSVDGDSGYLDRVGFSKEMRNHFKDERLPEAILYLSSQDFYDDNSLYYAFDADSKNFYSFIADRKRGVDFNKLANSNEPLDDFTYGVLSLANPEFLPKIKDETTRNICAVYLLGKGADIPKSLLNDDGKLVALTTYGVNLFDDKELQKYPSIYFQELLKRKLEDATIEIPRELIEKVKREYSDCLLTFNKAERTAIMNNESISQDKELITNLISLDGSMSIERPSKVLISLLDFKNILLLLKEYKSPDHIWELIKSNDLIHKKSDFREDFLKFLEGGNLPVEMFQKIINEYGEEDFISLCNEIQSVTKSVEMGVYPFGVKIPPYFDYSLSIYQKSLNSESGKKVLSSLNPIPVHLPHNVVVGGTLGGNINYFTAEHNLEISKVLLNSSQGSQKVSTQQLIDLITSLKDPLPLLARHIDSVTEYLAKMDDKRVLRHDTLRVTLSRYYNSKDAKKSVNLIIAMVNLSAEIPLRDIILNFSHIPKSRHIGLQEPYSSPKKWVGLGDLIRSQEHLRSIYTINPNILLEYLSVGEIIDLFVDKVLVALSDLHHKFVSTLFSLATTAQRKYLSEVVNMGMHPEYLIELGLLSDELVYTIPLNQIHLLSSKQRVSWMLKQSGAINYYSVYLQLKKGLGDKSYEVALEDTRIALTDHKIFYEPVIKSYANFYTIEDWENIFSNSSKYVRVEIGELVVNSETLSVEQKKDFLSKNFSENHHFNSPSVDLNLNKVELKIGRPMESTGVKGVVNPDGLNIRWIKLPTSLGGVFIRYFADESMKYVVVVSIHTKEPEIENKIQWSKLASIIDKYALSKYKKRAMLIHKRSYNLLFKKRYRSEIFEFMRGNLGGKAVADTLPGSIGKKSISGWALSGLE